MSFNTLRWTISKNDFNGGNSNNNMHQQMTHTVNPTDSLYNHQRVIQHEADTNDNNERSTTTNNNYSNQYLTPNLVSQLYRTPDTATRHTTNNTGTNTMHHNTGTYDMNNNTGTFNINNNTGTFNTDSPTDTNNFNMTTQDNRQYTRDLLSSINIDRRTRRSDRRRQHQTDATPHEENIYNTPRNQSIAQTNSDTSTPDPHAHWGPTLQLPRPKRVERIVLANVNGISQNPTMQIELFERLAKFDGTIYGITETHLDSARQYEATVPPLKQTMKRVWPHTKMVIADCLDKTKEPTSLRKFGGIMQITTGASCSRVRQNNKDKSLGRWASQQLILADGTKCAIYTCYRVCASSPSTAGPHTAYRQQWNVGVQNDINFEPRKQFMTDFQEELQQQRANGYEILVMGDFNTEISHPEMRQLMEQCDLIDLHEPFIDPTSTIAPATHINGSNKIDHILGTDLFLQASRHGGIILPTADNIADHRILILDLCQVKLNATNTDLTNADQRILNSTSPKKVAPYIDILEEKMTEAKIEQRLYTLCTRAAKPDYVLTERDELKFCRIDQQMTELMIYAERQCGKKCHGYHYSKALARAGHMISTLKKRRRTIIITELNTAGTAAERAAARTHLDQINDELRTAWSNLRDAQRHSRELRNLHLQDCAKLAAAQQNTDVEKVILEMLKQEKHSRAWAKIQRYIGNEKCNQLDRILIPEDNMREINDPTELHEELVKLSIRDMSLPEGSTFTTTPMDEIIPPWDPSPVNDEILNGSYEPPADCSQTVKELFTKLVADDTTTPSPHILNTEITTEQFRDAIKI